MISGVTCILSVLVDSLTGVLAGFVLDTLLQLHRASHLQIHEETVKNSNTRVSGTMRCQTSDWCKINYVRSYIRMDGRTSEEKIC